MRKFSSIAMILLVAAVVTQAATTYSSETADTAKLGVGAEVLGRGGTGVAVDGVNPLLNPAGIAGGENALKLRTMYTNLLNGDISYLMLGGSVPTPIGIYGITYLAGSATDIELRSGNTTIADSKAAYSNSTLVFTTGFKLADMSWLDWFPVWMNRNDLALGMNLKIFGQSAGVDGFQANGQDLDLGAIYKVNKAVSLGFNFQNVLPMSLGGNMHWQNNTNYGIAGQARFGAAFNIGEYFKLASEIDVRAGMTPLHLGAEYLPNEYLTFRAGLDQSIKPNDSIATDYTLGVGLNIKGFAVDYAYKPYSIENQNASHYFMLSYTGGKYDRQRRSPVQQNVIKQQADTKKSEVKYSQESDEVAVDGYFEASREDIHIIQPAAAMKVYDEKMNVRLLIKGDVDNLAINGKTVNAVKGGIVGTVVNLKYGKQSVSITYSKSGKKYRAVREILMLPTFSDISEGRWSKDVVEYMAALGIYLGEEMPVVYNGKASITVRDMAEIIAKYIRVKRGAVVDIDRATYDIIGLAKELGYPGGLNARTMVNRGLACAVVVKLGNVPVMKVTKSPFVDVAPGSWFTDSVMAAKNAGWVSGISVKGQYYFMPGDEISRETFINLMRPLVSDEINKLKI